MFCKLSALGLTALLAMSACVATEVDDGVVDGVADPATTSEPATSETAQSLSVFNWTAPWQIATGMWYSQVGAVGSRVLMVSSGSGNTLRWRERVGVNLWTAPQMISGQTSGQQVSLAPFGGYLYMVRSEYGNTTRHWISRFDPATSSWSPSSLLPYTSVGPPAIAAFRSALHFIGVTPGTNQLWQATMSSSGVFNSPVAMAGHYSASRVSAAAANCRLYIAHRAGSGSAVVFNFNDGNGWTYDRYIPAGPGGANVVANEPVIAERSNYVHLVYPATSNIDAQLMWTYFDGTSWPLAVSVGSTRTTYRPGLTGGGAGLVGVATTYYDSPAFSLEYAQPLPPYQYPCLIAQPF